VEDLPLTGERTVPGIPHENYWFRRHQVAYQHVSGLVSGHIVLDVGCGEGYGTAALATCAAEVIGIDYDARVVRHATATYRAPAFVIANLAALPIQGTSIDAVVSLQVIEHVWDHAQFLHECRRVLRPGGRLVITTPNRLTFSPGADEPQNPFHAREFSAAELSDLATDNGFAVVELSGVHAGPRLRSLDRRYDGFTAAQLAVSPDSWPATLRADVESVRAADFVVVPAADRDVDASLDVILTARCP
jgi:SAM-dependent methyltransferase